MDTINDLAGASGASLSGKERRALSARAHALKPVVWVAESGMTPGAMREIDRALAAHELIKIHAACTGRPARSALLTSICAELKAQPVQVIGKMLVAFRSRPAPIAEHNVASKPAKRSPKALCETNDSSLSTRSPSLAGKRMRVGASGVMNKEALDKRSNRKPGRTKPGMASTLGPKRRRPLRHT